MSSASFVFQTIQDLVLKFGNCSSADDVHQITIDLLQSLETLTNSDQIKDEKILSAIHATGVKLWNFVITKKTGKIASQVSCARARHVALHLTFLATFSDKSQTTARKQQAMALKTGRDWLDCNNPNMADTCFVLATECYMKLKRLIENSSETHLHLTKEHLSECHENMLKVYAFRAEVAMGQSQHETSLEYLKKSAELLSLTTLKEAEFLSNICYNFGLDCYQKELYQHSEAWLCESIDIGKNVTTKSNEQKATTYQLLAMVYMELEEEEHFQKALETINLSIHEHSHTKSLFLKLKIMLLLNKDDIEIMQAFQDIIHNPVLQVDTGIDCVALFSEKNRLKLCQDALEVLNVKYHCLAENIKVQLKKVECLLIDGEIAQVKEVIQAELLHANNGGAVFDKDTLKKLQLLLWETAHGFFEKSEFLEALTWYNYSLEFMKQSIDDHKNLSKLQRNRCSCFIEVHNYNEALVAIKESEKHDPTSPQVYFLLFKIHLKLKNDDPAMEAVDKLSQIGLEGSDVDLIHGLICLAAQLAFESGNRKISEVALEKIIVHVKDPKQVLVSLRCLTRLKFTYLSENNSVEEVKKVLALIEKALQIFKNMTLFDQKEAHMEVLWFNKIAWNLALSSSEHSLEMHQSFLLCYEFSQMLPEVQVNVSQQKSCLLMAAGSGLQISRDQRTENEKNRKLQEVWELIKKCYVVFEKLKKVNPSLQDPMLGFLLCYEFEVKARLGHRDLDDFLEKVVQLPSGHAEIFENFASVALSIPDALEFSVKSLKLAIKCHLEEAKVDFSSVSKVVHSLINVSLQKGGNTNAATKEDAYNFYEDTLKIIDTEARGEYPEMELIWLMTKAWNCGIHLYSAHHHEAAEKWCTLSMRFLKYLKDLKDNYEPHMSSVFADIVSRIQQSKVQMQVEE